MTINLITHIAICSICCVALHNAITNEGQILSWVRTLLWRAPKFITKPLYECLACMGTVYGIAYFTILYNTQYGFPFLFIIPFVLGVSGLNYLIQKALL